MKTVITGLVALLALNALSAQVYGTTDHTCINNLSSKKIKVSVLYNFAGHGKFNDRIIDPGTHATDEYGDGNCTFAGAFIPPIGVVISLQPGGCQTEIYLGCDDSIVLLNNPATHGVDIFLSRYGDINDPVYFLHSLKC